MQWLARGSEEGELVRDWAVAARKAVAVTPLVDADTPSIEDYGNVSHEIAFSVERDHVTLEAANLFALLHGQTVLGAGGVMVAVSEDSGSEHEITLAKAQLLSATTTEAGVSTVTTYHVVCGALSS